MNNKLNFIHVGQELYNLNEIEYIGLKNNKIVIMMKSKNIFEVDIISNDREPWQILESIDDKLVSTYIEKSSLV